MANISKLKETKDRDLFYFRQRSKNRIFEALTSFFAEEAEKRGLTKRDIAESLKRDPAQITRWLTSPSNLTIETISDLLLSLGAEMDYSVARFKDRAQPNEMHPLIARMVAPQVVVRCEQQRPQKTYETFSRATTNANTAQLSIS